METEMRIAHDTGGIGGQTIGKNPGDTCTVTLKVRYKGPGGTYYCSWGIMPGDNVPFVYHKDLVKWVKNQEPFTVPYSGSLPSSPNVTITLTGPFPDIQPSPASENYFDSLVFLQQNVAGQLQDIPGDTGGGVAWDDVYYRKDLQAAEFETLTAVFT